MTQRSLELTAETGITFDAAVISEEALGWARQYNYELVTGLTDTTRKLVQQSVSTFVETPGMTRGDLESLLAPAFGENRASMIAVTEVTRAYSQATTQHQQMLKDEYGLEMRKVWQTRRDDLTCLICGPLHGMPEDDWPANLKGGPPAHVNCRCGDSLTSDDAETVRQEALAGQTAREKLLREKVAGEKPGVVQPVIVGPTAQDVRKRIDEREKQLIDEGEFRTAEHKRAYRELLYVDNPAQFEAKESWNFSAKRKEAYQRGVAEFRKLVGTGTVDDALIYVEPTRSGRSFQGGQTINMSTSSGTKTAIHEMGHWLEEQDSEVYTKAAAFYDRRTAGEKATWLGDNYDKNEITRRDKFLSPYMGKDYGRDTTEIVSMGMEYYWDDPRTFARKDPEYFDFIFDLLRGK